MAQNYFSIAAPRVGRNSLVDFSPVGNALEAYGLSRQRDMERARMAEAEQYQRSRNAMQDARQAQRDQLEAAERNRPKMMSVGGSLLSVGPDGSAREVYRAPKDPTSTMPSNVQEWEYFSKLPEQDQRRYLEMRRNPTMLNTGTSFVDPTGRRETIPIDNAGKQEQEEVGIARGKAAVSAPNDIVAADTALELLSSIRTDPARSVGTGVSSLGNVVPGTPGFGFQKKVDQATSGAFLTAIGQLRGLGALSNQEGDTAKAAVTRLTTGLSEADFIKALDDYQKIVERGRAKAQSLIQAPASAPPAASAQPSRPDPLGLFGGS